MHMCKGSQQGGIIKGVLTGKKKNGVFALVLGSGCVRKGCTRIIAIARSAGAVRTLREKYAERGNKE